MKKKKKSQAKVAAPRKRVPTTVKEDIGKLMLDVGKLIFGSIFLGSILRGEIPRTILGIAGFTAAMALFIIGILMARKKKPGGDGDAPAKSPVDKNGGE